MITLHEYLIRLDKMITEERLSLSGTKLCANYEEYQRRVGKIIGMTQIRDNFKSVFIDHTEEDFNDIDLQEY